MNVLDEIPPAREMPEGVARLMRYHLEQSATSPAPATRPQRGVGWRLAAGAVAAGAVGVLVMQPWASTSAYASWTTVPDHVDSATTKTLGESCSAKQKAHFKESKEFLPVVAERRGDSTAVLMSGSGQLSLCVSTSSGELGGQMEVTPMPTGKAIVLDANPGLLSGPDAWQAAYGRVSADVTGVVVRTHDGRTVTASTSRGYFLCWWPSGAAPASITATDANGQQVGRLTQPVRSTLAPVPSHN